MTLAVLSGERITSGGHPQPIGGGLAASSNQSLGTLDATTSPKFWVSCGIPLPVQLPETPCDLVRPGGLEPPNLRIKKVNRSLSGAFWRPLKVP